MRKTIVQKYGGTSVGTAERLLGVTDIIKATREDHNVIVVVSAMSSYIKKEGTTSRLLEAADEVLQPNSTKYLNILDAIESSHLKAVNEGIVGDDPEIARVREAVTKDVRGECQRLRSFCSAAEIVDEISPRSRDVIISVGEKLSARVLAGVLQSHGVNSVYINLEKVVDSSFEGKDIDQHFYDHLTRRLSTVILEATHSRLQELQGASSPLSPTSAIVPVVTGYFGPVPGGILATIGRGYTDLTAALIAVGVKAAELQIWKEVDGIFTADPRKCTNARLLASITPEEAAELTYYGSEVIHPFTMEQVIRAAIPIRIKNTFKPQGFGTVIVPDGISEMDLVRQHLENSPRLSPLRVATPVGISPLNSVNGLGNSLNGIATPSRSTPTPPLPVAPVAVQPPSLSRTDSSSPDVINGTFAFEGLLSSTRHPTAVTIKDDVIVLNVHSNRKAVAHGFLAHIFSILDKYGIVVDLISTSEVHVSLVLGPNVSEKKLDAAIEDLKKLGMVSCNRGFSILSLVGRQMRNMVGIASKMFETLAKHKINIEMISQGASEINISCVVASKRAEVALRAIHDVCIIRLIEGAKDDAVEALENKVVS